MEKPRFHFAPGFVAACGSGGGAGPVCRLALLRAFGADGAERWRSTRCSLRARPRRTGKQSMVEIEQELLQEDVKLDWVAAVWAWVRRRGGATSSTAVARADHLQH